MRGFQTQTKRKAHATGYASGGMVRGPGTGISDEVPDQVPEGTYIMPADSTTQIGPDKLAGMGARGFKAGGKKSAGGKSVPVNLSNGEFKMPPDQVHAVGVQALEQMKNATHTPAAQQAGEPELFFANGGPVFGSRGLEGLKALIPKVAAMGFPQKRAAPVAPAAPAQGSRNVADLKTVIPQMEAMGFKQNQQYLADGGPVRRQSGVNMDEWAQQQGQQRATATRGQEAMAAASRAAAPAATPLQRNAMQTAMYVQGAQAAAASRPAAGFAPAPRAPAAAPAPGSTSPSTLYFQDRAQELKDQVGQGNYAQAAGTAARSAVQGLGMYGVELADKAGTPLVNAARGFGRGVFGADANAAPSTTPAAAAPAAPAPAAVTQATPSMAGAGRGMVNPSAATPSAGPQLDNTPTAPTAAATNPGNVTRVGNSYSGMNVTGDLTVNGQAPRGGFMVADGARGFNPGVPATTAPQGVTAPTVLNSSNSWQARNDLRNLEVSASSITNNGGRFDQTKGKNPAQAAYLAALQADATARGAQPALDQEAMRQNAGIQREQVQQAGGLQREVVQQTGANQRSARGFEIDRQRVGIEGQRANSEIEARGFQTRAALQQEQLRNVLTDPNASSQQKAQAQAALQALTGNGDSWKAVALQGGTDAQGNKTESILGAVNERTGEMKRMGAEQGAKTSSQFEKGAFYVDGQGRRARYTGSGWEPA